MQYGKRDTSLAEFILWIRSYAAYREKAYMKVIIRGVKNTTVIIYVINAIKKFQIYDLIRG